MPFDSWENAALLDTQETNHVALLLSPDGGSQDMQLYIGEKGKDTNGHASNDLLARNGLAWGSYYYLNDTLPTSGTSTNGSFDTTASGALSSSKLEDVDTSPSDPTRVVLGDQNSGLFTFDFLLDFTGGSFSAAGSGFSITKVLSHVDNVDDTFGDADNLDWSDATTLDGTTHAEGLIFVNEDTGTGNGEIWVLEPDGSNLTKIGDTAGISGSTETSGILDISVMVGYNPGSVLLTNNQGSNSSLSVLINPSATPAVEVITDAADYTVWRDSLGQNVAPGTGADGNGDGYIGLDDYLFWKNHFGSLAASSDAQVPEPATFLLVLVAPLLSGIRWC
jgi:hypothetical protein